MLECSWADGGRGNFCLDTGSSVGIVDAAKLEHGKPAEAGPSMVVLRDFSVEGLSFGERSFVVQDLSHLTPNGAPFAGLVGYNVLQGRRMIIDFERSRIFLDTTEP
jgi:hypothetical protein